MRTLLRSLILGLGFLLATHSCGQTIRPTNITQLRLGPVTNAQEATMTTNDGDYWYNSDQQCYRQKVGGVISCTALGGLPYVTVGSTGGKVDPPVKAPQAFVVASGGNIAIGTYYCVQTYTNLNGQTPRGAQVTVNVAANSSRVFFNNGADYNWLSGAFGFNVYCATASGGPYKLQRPYNRILNVGNCQRTSNVTTCDTVAVRHGWVDGDIVSVNGNASVGAGGHEIKSYTDPVAGNSTVTFPDPGADSGPTAGGTIFFYTGIPGTTDTQYPIYLAEHGLMIDTIQTATATPPTSNTATIDPIQVAINRARDVTAATGTFNQAPIAKVMLGSGVTYTVTTPLIVSYSNIEAEGKRSSNGFDVGATIKDNGNWGTQTGLGVVMMIGPHFTCAGVGVRSMSAVNAMFAGYGGTDGGHFKANGCEFWQSKSSPASDYISALRVDDMSIGFDWYAYNTSFSNSGARVPIYVSRSALADFRMVGGRINSSGAVLTLSGGIKSRGGAQDREQAQLGILNVPSLSVDLSNVAFEVATGPVIDLMGGRARILDGTIVADSTASAGCPYVVGYGIDYWNQNTSANTGIEVSGIGSVISGQGNCATTIKVTGPSGAPGAIVIKNGGGVQGSGVGDPRIWLDAGGFNFPILLDNIATNTGGLNPSNPTGNTSGSYVTNYGTSGVTNQVTGFNMDRTGCGSANVCADVNNYLAGGTYFGGNNRRDNGWNMIFNGGSGHNMEWYLDSARVANGAYTASNLFMKWNADGVNVKNFILMDLAGTAEIFHVTANGFGNQWMFCGAAGSNGVVKFACPISTNSQITSTLAGGTAPFVVTSTTEVANLNVANWHAKTGIDFTAALDFGSIATLSCAELTITATGAAANDAVAPSWPAAIETGLSGMMYVSAVNTVTVRLCNVTVGSIDPASRTYGGRVIH